jgi:multicomponent K+:H+ antiporter subunit A
VHLPIVGAIELASAMVFDVGVFLTVVGTVLLSLSQIAQVEARAERKPVPEGPADIVLPGRHRARPSVPPAAQAAVAPASPSDS